MSQLSASRNNLILEARRFIATELWPATPGAALRTRRRALGLSQDRLSHAAAIGKRRILVAEADRQCPDIIVRRLDAALACLEQGGGTGAARQASLALKAAHPAPRVIPEHAPCPECGGEVRKIKRETIAEFVVRLLCGYCTRRAEADEERERAAAFISGVEALSGEPFAVGNVRPRDYGRVPTMPAAHVPSQSAVGGNQ